MLSMPVKAALKQVLPPKLTHRLIALTNYYSGEPELKQLKYLVDGQRNSIDIGANKGSYTYFLARLSPLVYAYEPNPELAEFLRRAAAANVSVYPMALSDHEGTATLAIPIREAGEYDQLGSLQQRESGAGESGGAMDAVMKTFTVPLQRLDDRGHTNIGFIKIDVEGHEEAVIDGATTLLTTQRPVLLIEIEQKHHPEKDIGDIFAKVLSLGYAGFFFLDGALHPLAEFSPTRHQDSANYRGLASLGKTYICNFIFKPV